MRKQIFISKSLVSSLLIIILIASTTHAEVPFTQAKGVYTATKDEYKHISPFWGMVAIHGKLLERIRFFGFYKKDKTGRDTYLDKNDAISRLLLILFPSTDGIRLVANASDSLFKNLASEENLTKINDIIEILQLTEKLDKEEKADRIYKKIESLSEEIETLTEFSKLLVDAYEQEAFYANPQQPSLQRYPQNIVIISLLSFLVKVADSKDQLVRCLPFFYKEKKEEKEKEKEKEKGEGKEKEDVKGKGKEKKDEKREGKEKEDVKGKGKEKEGKEKEERQETNAYNKAEYFRYKEKIIQNDKEIIEIIQNPKNIHNNVELAFFLAKGFEAYENLIAEPIGYLQKSVLIQGAEEPFSDCGETSLRNFFMLLLSAGNGGIVDSKSLISLKKKILQDNLSISAIDLDTSEQYKPYQKFIAFIDSHQDFSQGAASTNIYNDWAEVVSNLNANSTATGINLVQYGCKKPKENDEVYEIICYRDYRDCAKATSIFNMFNVIARIIPDEILRQPWTEGNEEEQKLERYTQVEKKLDQLCKLFSREGIDDINVSWKSESNNKQITSDFPSINFTINGENAFQWNFKKVNDNIGHFDIVRLTIPEEDWRINFSYTDFQYFNSCQVYNEWLASLFPRTPDTQMETEYAKRFPIAVSFTPSLKKLEGIERTTKIILSNKMQSFSPLINRWIEPFLQSESINLWIDIMEIFSNLDRNKSEDITIGQLEKKKQKESNFIQPVIENILATAKKKKILDPSIVIQALKSKKFGAAEIFIKTFIKTKANLSISDDDGNAPLHLAVLQNESNIVKLLLSNKLLNQLNNDKNTPLHLASAQGNVVIAGMVFSKKALTIRNSDGNTPLHLASSQGHVDIVNMLLEEEIDCNLPNKGGNTPLHLAISSNNIAIFKSLICSKHNVNIEIINKIGNSPLHIGACKENPEFVFMLLNRGASYDIPGENGNTSLHLAVIHNAIGVLELLVKYHALLDKVNTANQTPLYLAAINRKIEIVQMLIEGGAETRNIDGYKLLKDIANEIHNVYQREIIQRISKGIDKGTHDLQNEYIEIIHLLIESGTTIDTKAKIEIQNESSDEEWSDEGWSDDEWGEGEKKKGDKGEKKVVEQNIITYIDKQGYKLLAQYLRELK